MLRQTGEIVAGGWAGKTDSCFTILLGHESVKQIITLLPFTMPAVGIDVSCLADINKHTSPSHRTIFGVSQRSKWVVGTGNHKTSKHKGRQRHRSKPPCRGRETATR